MKLHKWNVNIKTVGNDYVKHRVWCVNKTQLIIDKSETMRSIVTPDSKLPHCNFVACSNDKEWPDISAEFSTSDYILRVLIKTVKRSVSISAPKQTKWMKRTTDMQTVSVLKLTKTIQ